MSLANRVRQIADLRMQLASLWPPHELAGSDKALLITVVTSIIGLVPSHDCDLRLMSSQEDISGIPTLGKNLIIVAPVEQVLHFRIFDLNGKLVVDADEKRLTDRVRQIADLRMQLASLWPPHELAGNDKAGIINAVTSIIGLAPSFVEMVVWMRRGYRSTLLGSPSVREVLETELPAVLGVAKDALPTLWTRYPKPGEDGESNHEWGLWLNFLARFDFRRCHAKESNAWKCTLLKRKNR
jgi:hypothetical protein